MIPKVDLTCCTKIPIKKLSLAIWTTYSTQNVRDGCLYHTKIIQSMGQAVFWTLYLSELGKCEQNR